MMHMATNHYTAPTVSGPVFMRRERKQGRPKGSGEGRQRYSYTASSGGQAIIEKKAAKLNMRVSQYVELAAILFDMQYSSEEYCSKT